ncbi:bifunctional Tetratricopeptide-like helical domain superfamily/Tetratricopeptide repeat [Babesia duncani]|uniref:Bifunctional Tetratricopeptide-like helical domain superfamily/Tetratricopeptide repeat n=1 Tax=Babesia duncani TaxID=323732 RepID=A0AAD9UPP6_9APIC|nr:bifunctional Tetratricopeptide-like helical domain superfamily/Tetratricopeptide repeat [Babesia duncani]
MFESVHELILKGKFQDAVKILNELARANNAVTADLKLINSPYDECWRYESYPEKYGDRRGTMCPFSLFLIYAYYPFYVGSAYTALDRLHAINTSLESELALQETQGTPRPLVIARILSVGLLIANVLMNLDRPKEAIKFLLECNLVHDPTDSASNAMLASIYWQIGDTENALKYIHTASKSSDNLHAFYSGVYYVMKENYEQAACNFKAFKDLQVSSSTIGFNGKHIIDNNIAISFFYQGSEETVDELVEHSKSLLQVHVLSNKLIYVTG